MTDLATDLQEPLNAIAKCAVHPEVNSVGTCQRCGRFMCGECAGASIHCLECNDRVTVTPPPIGGWLYVPLIFQLWLAPIFLLVSLGMVAAEVVPFGAAILSDGPWVAYTVVDLLFSFASTGLALFILPKFRARKAGVPKLMQSMYALNIVGHVVSMIGLSLLGQLATLPGEEGTTAGQMMRPVFMAMIWMAYFSKSERVKRTFIA